MCARSAVEKHNNNNSYYYCLADNIICAAVLARKMNTRIILYNFFMRI